jgi:hypothetical protein
MSAQLDRVMAKSGEKIGSGYQLLAEVKAFISRFCAFPNEHSLVAVTLWAAHAHIIKHFHTTPRLALLSPEPSSGKTRVLEVLDLLVPSSMFVFNASPAAIFRSLGQSQVTLLFDEADAVWNKRGRDDNHEDLRALLNAGYKRGATIPRCTGPQFEVTHFDAYAAVALAGLGQLPDTIMSRSVIIKMRRRAPNENVEPFRSRRHADAGHELRDRLAGWALAVGVETGEAWPEIPAGVEDRNEEIWEPLLAVAEAAGGAWPQKAKEACVFLVKAASTREQSLGIRLLADLRTIFSGSDDRKLSTDFIIDSLKSSHSGLADDAPWADLNGDGINARKLAKLLKEYGITSKKIRVNDATMMGYTHGDLLDAWQRYLPSLPSANTEHPEQAEQTAF